MCLQDHFYKGAPYLLGCGNPKITLEAEFQSQGWEYSHEYFKADLKGTYF